MAGGPSETFRFKELTGEELMDLRTNVVKSVIKVTVIAPTKRFDVAGIILAAELSVCYVIVRGSMVHLDCDYLIEFPGGQHVTKKGTDFYGDRNTILAVVKINHQYDLRHLATAVKFAEVPVSMNEKVYLLVLAGGGLTSGSVVSPLNQRSENLFMISCGPDVNNEYGGGYVFDDNGELVGIVTTYFGTCQVMTVSSIKNKIRRALLKKTEMVEELERLKAL